MSQNLIEAVARLMAEIEYTRRFGEPVDHERIAMHVAVNWQAFAHDARDAIAAIERSRTHRIVPIAPTDLMCAIARFDGAANGSPMSRGPEDVYAAMLAVAPKLIT